MLSYRNVNICTSVIQDRVGRRSEQSCHFKIVFHEEIFFQSIQKAFRNNYSVLEMPKIIFQGTKLRHAWGPGMGIMQS